MLDNAVKFTPSGGSVDVDVWRQGQDAILRVSDTGLGIGADMLPRVFELFAQAAQPIDRAAGARVCALSAAADQPMDRSVGGLGIGLTLSRRLVEMFGGTIAASSDG